ncbi:DEAD/DEAH box helicase family protein [Chloroflexota bacterium]
MMLPLRNSPRLTHCHIWKNQRRLVYNPKIPIDNFDFIITDECQRSIYHLWRQVLEYFDAFTIGLTATPSKQTRGFFNQKFKLLLLI